MPTGKLTINGAESRLDGVLLAKRGGLPDPLAAATGELIAQELDTCQRLNVSGSNDFLGTKPVIYMTSASCLDGRGTRASRPRAVANRHPAGRSRAIKPATDKVTTGKPGAKKASSKKTGNKKTAPTKKAAAKMSKKNPQEKGE